MRSSNEIMRYVSSAGNHFLDVHYQGKWKNPHYYNSTVCGNDEYGIGAANCVDELYLTVEVVYAFTCRYSDNYSSDDGLNNAMVCLTDNCRVIIGLENRCKTYEHELDSYDLKRIKKKEFTYGSSSHCTTISVGAMNFQFEQTSRSAVDHHVKKVLNMIIDLEKKYSDH